MAFNLARYNLNPFNARGTSVKYIKALGIETISASIGSALQIYPLSIGYERVGESISGVMGRFLNVEFAETVDELVANGQISVILYLRYAETVSAETDIAAEDYLSVISTETVSANTHQDALIHPKTMFAEAINADTSLGSNIYCGAEGYELVSESASLEAREYRTCVLTLTLQPGQRLVIDAQNYNVLLDGENAIDTHSGDWLDELDRRTIDISITASAGVANLDATILYTERFL